MNANELIECLRSVNDSRLNLLKSELSASPPSFVQLSSGDGAPLFRIYQVRSQIDKDKGGSTHGYEDLLPNLENASGQAYILAVNRSFRIFVSGANLSILG